MIGRLVEVTGADGAGKDAIARAVAWFLAERRGGHDVPARHGRCSPDGIVYVAAQEERRATPSLSDALILGLFRAAVCPGDDAAAAAAAAELASAPHATAAAEVADRLFERVLETLRPLRCLVVLEQVDCFDDAEINFFGHPLLGSSPWSSVTLDGALRDGGFSSGGAGFSVPLPQSHGPYAHSLGLRYQPSPAEAAWPASPADPAVADLCKGSGGEPPRGSKGWLVSRLLRPLLQEAPGVRVLITRRLNLGLGLGGWVGCTCRSPSCNPSSRTAACPQTSTACFCKAARFYR